MMTESSSSSEAQVKRVCDTLASHLEPKGFETHPFLVGWYNAVVAEKFRLPHDHDTLAFAILSRPNMFEKTFVPYLARRKNVRRENDGLRADPLDECMRETLAAAAEALAGVVGGGHVSVIHDFELLPNRRPKVLVQTAAHVSGAVTFFRSEDVEDKTLSALLSSSMGNSKVYPVCLHPRLGGWFAIRAVVIVEGMLAPRLKVANRVRVSLKQEEIANLLILYNLHWRDWRFRDVVRAEETYSQWQRDYFSASPADREPIVQKILAIFYAPTV